MIKKFSLHCIEKVLFFIGIFLLTSEILKQLLLTFVVNNGHYNLWYFPFQLCSLPMYLLVLYPFFHTEPARNTILGFLSTYNLLGGIAVFFDTSGMHYPLLILTVHSNGWDDSAISLYANKSDLHHPYIQESQGNVADL